MLSIFLREQFLTEFSFIYLTKFFKGSFSHRIIESLPLIVKKNRNYSSFAGLKGTNDYLDRANFYE